MYTHVNAHVHAHVYIHMPEHEHLHLHLHMHMHLPLHEGSVSVGDSAELIRGPHPDWTLARVAIHSRDG